MKKVLVSLIFLFAGLYTKAQTPHIKIAYDENGNRIMRYYVSGRPAPPAEDTSSSSDKAIVADIADSTNKLKLDFKVYPNPSADNFNIAIDGGMLQHNCEIVLTDQLGKIYLRKALTHPVTTISTRHLTDGVYYINVSNGKSKSSIKIVKLAN